MTVGIVSDTHGLMRPETVAALSGCNRIIHAGDLGKLEVYERLSQIAPTAAIRGNVDRDPWAESFPETLRISVGGVNTYVLHDLRHIAIDPAVARVDLVISGHSHQPAIKEQTGVLYVNPGSAGPRRFSLPITLVRLKICPVVLRTELIDVLTNRPITSVTTARRKGSA